MTDDDGGQDDRSLPLSVDNVAPVPVINVVSGGSIEVLSDGGRRIFGNDGVTIILAAAVQAAVSPAFAFEWVVTQGGVQVGPIWVEQHV